MYVHVCNCCATSTLTGCTPYELWYKHKPNISHLRIWGCNAYVHVQKDKRGQLGSHMEKCMSMFAIAVPHLLLLDVLPMNCGISTSPISAIFGFGGVMHMFMCKRTKEVNLDHIWRNVCPCLQLLCHIYSYWMYSL